MERAEKLNMEKLEQVTGGNYGGSSGNWVSARVKASGGLYRFSKSGSKFSNTGRNSQGIECTGRINTSLFTHRGISPKYSYKRLTLSES